LETPCFATFSGALCHNRLGVALSSLAEDERQRQSPGALLLTIEEVSAKGIAFYDIGVCAARHKDQWCFQTDVATGRHGAAQARDQIEPAHSAERVWPRDLARSRSARDDAA
jgi:CelD/BcsL family acetyltransferase involved in cellulose biosynthesis